MKDQLPEVISEVTINLAPKELSILSTPILTTPDIIPTPSIPTLEHAPIPPVLPITTHHIPPVLSVTTHPISTSQLSVLPQSEDKQEPKYNTRLMLWLGGIAITIWSLISSQPENLPASSRRPWRNM